MSTLQREGATGIRDHSKYFPCLDFFTPCKNASSRVCINVFSIDAPQSDALCNAGDIESFRINNFLRSSHQPSVGAGRDIFALRALQEHTTWKLHLATSDAESLPGTDLCTKRGDLPIRICIHKSFMSSAEKGQSPVAVHGEIKPFPFSNGIPCSKKSSMSISIYVLPMKASKSHQPITKTHCMELLPIADLFSQRVQASTWICVNKLTMDALERHTSWHSRCCCGCGNPEWAATQSVAFGTVICCTSISGSPIATAFIAVLTANGRHRCCSTCRVDPELAAALRIALGAVICLTCAC
mmetsp:Transcript_11471/g.20612  ORF Transcript_11471/g.20612 Transcript_11471/m.20612 type:complete len:298 (-) Transcript_11471:216-1109(-)